MKKYGINHIDTLHPKIGSITSRDKTVDSPLTKLDMDTHSLFNMYSLFDNTHQKADNELSKLRIKVED